MLFGTKTVGRQQWLSPQSHLKQLQLSPSLPVTLFAKQLYLPNTRITFFLLKKLSGSILGLALLLCQGVTRSSGQSTPGTTALLVPSPSRGYPKVSSSLPTKGHGDGPQLPAAATDVSAFWGQRKLCKVFLPFQGGMPKQSRNRKYITLLTFPNQEGNTAVGLLESVHGAKLCHWKKKKRMGIAPV